MQHLWFLRTLPYLVQCEASTAIISTSPLQQQTGLFQLHAAMSIIPSRRGANTPANSVNQLSESTQFGQIVGKASQLGWLSGCHLVVRPCLVHGDFVFVCDNHMSVDYRSLDFCGLLHAAHALTCYCVFIQGETWCVVSC